MGVFARFRRRSKATEEASTAEVKADTLTAESEAEAVEEAEGASGTEGEAAAGEPAEAAAEDVEIPKQQTAEQAADMEAGESART